MATLGSSQPLMVVMETEKPTATMALGPWCRRRRLWDSKQTPGAQRLGDGRGMGTRLAGVLSPACGVGAHPTFPTPGKVKGADSIRDTHPGRGLAPQAPSSSEPPSPGGGDPAGWVVSTSPAPACSPRTLLEHRLDPMPTGVAPWAHPSPEAAKWTEGLSTRAREPVIPRAVPTPPGAKDG